MCGITGWVSFERDLTAEGPALQAMTATMSRRGPDAEGSWLDRHAALGHRRLAIVDLPGGTQPMVAETPGGAVALTYSGETYNYRELRDELRRRGHSFRTDSDTEVVLRGYLEWGDAVAERLTGMYAFAVWDARTQRLVMIRDRMGVKPLYYAETADGVLFGSEPKAILANPLGTRLIDLDGLRELFSMVKTPGHAVWAGMREVPPGSMVTVDRSGLRTTVYWKLWARPHTNDTATTVARVRELLDDAVGGQLVADVPRCTLLSGGLDSSAVTALSARRLGVSGERVRTFAVDFAGYADNFVPDEDHGTPDTPFVQDMRRHVDSVHQDIVLDSVALSDPEVRRATVTARDLPQSLGDMDASLYLMFKAIREHSTVALSGESADEVFGGYRWFHDPEAQRAEAFPWLPPGWAEGARYMLAPQLWSQLRLEDYADQAYRDAVSEVDEIAGESGHERRMRVLSHLNLTRFLRVLLDRKDRLSMAVGLEVRVPFCDHRLVEYVHNAPWSMKTFDGREKSLLRAATRDLLPASVVARKKSQYPSTQDPIYTAALQQQLKELLADDRDNPVFELFNEGWLRYAATVDPAALHPGMRGGMENVLAYATWFEAYRPQLRLTP